MPTSPSAPVASTSPARSNVDGFPGSKGVSTLFRRRLAAPITVLTELLNPGVLLSVSRRYGGAHGSSFGPSVKRTLPRGAAGRAGAEDLLAAGGVDDDTPDLPRRLISSARCCFSF